MVKLVYFMVKLIYISLVTINKTQIQLQVFRATVLWSCAGSSWGHSFKLFT